MFEPIARLVGRAALCAAAAVLPTATFAQDAVPEKPAQLSILSGSTGGSWYAYSSGLIPIFQKEGITVTTMPGGGASNPLRISAGEFLVGFGQTSANFDASKGQGAFEGRDPITNLQNIALMSTDHVHLICLADSEVNSWKDLPKARFAAPAATTGSWGNFLAGLHAVGVSEDELNIVTRGNSGDNMTALRDREADCASYTSAWPVSTVTEVANSVDLKFIGLSDDEIAEVEASNPGFIAGTIPAGAYRGLDKDIKVYMAGSALMASESLPEGDAYWIVKTIYDNLDEVRKVHEGLKNLDGETMVRAPVFKMHPGAAKFYREVGLMD
ncbi:TAXI family TRAP transporter solute-binding subunit [Acuticoccus mangrovi]|uniref:TAXI family TRAP transporter solute-binding subunit n=1 Tax=Acuticoccus mangrovi TaxID=2796142 RepID=A0A934IP86_9HYPH|nr:TAXI family TRAP transporter solute-binding subunit [Acuticoccus mangrovi]MBJ3778531.1 TAXI family TRAP transporter solute-binding subunit [Acuticoccus mangrovi]